MDIGHSPLRDKVAIQYMNAVFSEIKYEDLENISHDALDAAWRNG